jgi:hypothetical protein
LQFLATEVALRGSLLEKRGFPREINGFRKATWKSNDVGQRHFSTFQGDATMSTATLQSILSQHGIPRTCWEAWRAMLSENTSAPTRVALIRWLRNVGNYAGAFNAVLDELSKQVKHKFPPKRACRKAS